MKVCTTCGRQWDLAHDRCPDDGTQLSQPKITTGQLAIRTEESAPDDNDRLAPGTRVGEYEIERQIGEGGMGMVYGARHPVIGKRAAIKVLNARYTADPEAVKRFVQEAQAVNRIGHANIVDIFSFGALADGRQYFAMEWLQGETLGQRIAKGPLPIDDAIAVLVALARALEAAHAAGIIHRDLKPDNVFLVTEDDGFRVKLLDFGIAKLSNQATASKTATGVVVGTPHYMAPEQAKGQTLDGRTDLYALGAVANAMVVGESPFETEESAVETLAAHIAKPPTPPHERRADIPPALEALVLELLAKEPTARPSVAELRRRLGALATRSGVTPIRTETSQPVATPAEDDLDVPPRRARWPLALIGVVAVAGAGVAIYLATRPSSSPRPAASAAPAPAPAPTITSAPVPVPVPVPVPAPVPAPTITTAPAPQRGTLDLSIDPSSATVAIDGEPVSLDHGRASVALAFGKHELVASAQGYKAATQNVDIASADATTLHLRLEKPRAAKTARPNAPATTPPANDSDGVVDPFKH